MNKKYILIIISIVVLLFIINSFFENDKSNKDSDYYLTSPWVTERIDWFFLTLPEKWIEANEEIEKSRDKYDKISYEAHMYKMVTNGLYLTCMYMNAKDEIYENWSLDNSSTAIINQVLYNLNCQDISLNKLPPFNNPIESNYEAFSNCKPNDFHAKSRAIRYKNHILIVCTCFNDSDSTLNVISDRILSGIENKYQEVSNVK
ncbi:MAG: hypothetical protein KAT68_19645 [Bacteroidales bacterium]|jgi:hypothetical protein|nr:hypothetical protein [Bacteroidales bacterium]